jgi:hypothetical protein
MKRLAVQVYGGAGICVLFFFAPEAWRQSGLACILGKGKKGGLVSQGDFIRCSIKRLFPELLTYFFRQVSRLISSVRRAQHATINPYLFTAIWVIYNRQFSKEIIVYVTSRPVSESMQKGER